MVTRTNKLGYTGAQPARQLRRRLLSLVVSGIPIDRIHHNRKVRCMSRTNIHLDDQLVDKGMKITGLRTKRELVDLALRELIRKEDQKSILSLEGKIRWEGNLDELRGRGVLTDDSSP